MNPVIGIKFEIDHEAATKSLNRLMASVQDRTEPNKRLSDSLMDFININFETEGGFTEKGSWEPLEDSTIAWKERHGYSMILQNTGALRGSFRKFYSKDSAGVGAVPLHVADKRPPHMAMFHEFGMGNLPARPMLPTHAQAGQIAMRIYGEYINEAVKRS